MNGPRNGRGGVRGMFRLDAMALLLAYPSWLAMMAVHELGHVLHALVSGGSVRYVELPLWGFSYTALDANPAPLWVAFGGPAWGALLPLAVAWACRRARAGRWALAFAAFCALANGAYLATAVVQPVGDAADLVRLGIPRWLVATVGGALVAIGLGCLDRAWVRKSQVPGHRERTPR